MKLIPNRLMVDDDISYLPDQAPIFAGAECDFGAAPS